MDVEKFEEVLESWKEFVVGEVLKRIEKELEVDLEVLMDSLVEKGFIKER
ncbi:MAG: hypothetical protein ACE5LC_05265 [Candidatus Aminicenantales bacterium]